MIRLGFLGAGNMATAMISGIVKSDIPVSICAYDLDFQKCRALSNYGVHAVDSPQNLVQDSEYLILAVKPQNFEEALASIRDTVKKETNGEYSNVIPVNFKTMTEMPVDSTSVSNFIRSLKKLPEKDRKKIIEKFVDEYVQTSLGYAQ